MYDLFSQDESKEVILSIFPQFKYYERLRLFNQLNKKIKIRYDSCLILALLIVDKSNNFEYFCHKYKTSNSIKNRLNAISQNFENIKNKNFFTKQNIKKQIYILGKDTVLDLLLFSLSINKFKNFDVMQLVDHIQKSEIPKFPISGNYLKEQGYEGGEMLGAKLRKLEEKWINNNFVIDKEDIKISK